MRGLLLRHSHYYMYKGTSFIPKVNMSSSDGKWKREVCERSNFKYFLPIQSRWADNDQYGHVNNVNYYSYFDTVINHYLIKYCELDTDLKTTNCMGLMVDTQCTFRKPVTFPEVVLAGLSVLKIGNSSVHYRIGLFAQKNDSGKMLYPLSGSFSCEDDFIGHEREACAIGKCVHVFVNPKENNKSVTLGNNIRNSLQRLITDNSKL